MTSLHDRLADLAAEAGADPAGHSGRDLWDRGRRVRRNTLAGTALVVVICVLVAAVGGIAVVNRAHPHELRPAGSSAGLPDRVWSPSAWLPGTGSSAPGQLAMVLPSDRAGWRGTSPGWVGISASTGEYRFLDLPGRAQGTAIALAPDGRSVAYWLAGSPSGSPTISPGSHGDTVTGIGWYDTVTGQVRRQRVATKHGIWADWLLWADDQTLVAGITQSRTNAGEGDSAPPLVWPAGADAEADPRLDNFLRGAFAPAGGGHGLLWTAEGDGHRVIRVDTSDPATTIALSGGMGPRGSAVDASGSRAASIGDRGAPSYVRWASASTPSRRVAGSVRTLRVLSWVDARHILVVQSTALSERPDESEDFVLSVLDVGRSDRQVLVEGSGYLLGEALVATDLAGVPTYHAAEPPRPFDPRKVLASLASVLVAGAVVVVLWRRRRVGRR